MFKNYIFTVFLSTLLLACSGSGGSSQVQLSNPSTPIPGAEPVVKSESCAEEKSNLPYFFAGAAGGDNELWKSDGTKDGTVRVKNINDTSDSYPDNLLPVGETLYFYAKDDVHGRELWRSDGSEEGTYMVKDINTHTLGVENTGDGVGSGDLLNIGGIVYFLADDGVNGQELWRSDGSNEGTYIVKNIASIEGVDEVQHVAKAGGKLFLRVDNDDSTKSFWVSDGTPEGTQLLRDGLSLKSYSICFKDELYFQANDQIHGDELWRSDGTVAGTVMLKDINPSGSNSSSPINFAKTGDAIYFQAKDDTHGNELWKSDGTEAGTVLVKDISSGDDSRPNHLTVIDNIVYFSADDGVNGSELWKSDGSEQGTVMVTGINLANMSGMEAINDVLYFSANDGATGLELWRSDGTEDGTQRVTDINIGISDSLPYLRSHLHSKGSSGDPYVLPDGRFFINARETNYGRELYLSDGLVGGITSLLKDINIGADDGFYNSDE